MAGPLWPGRRARRDPEVAHARLELLGGTASPQRRVPPVDSGVPGSALGIRRPFRQKGTGAAPKQESWVRIVDLDPPSPPVPAEGAEEEPDGGHEAPALDLGPPRVVRVDGIGQVTDTDLEGEDTPFPPAQPRWLPETVRRARFDPGRRGAVVLIAVAVLAAVVTGVLVWRARPVARPVAALPENLVTASEPGTAAASLPTVLVVDVAGKVRHPGLVRVPDGARVADAIRAAGGILPGARVGVLNLAARLADGQQVIVGLPGTGTGATAGAGTGTAEPGAPVDLNTATADQLDTLPGVGPATAQKIIDWRTSNGPFTSVDQLQEVSGIGPTKFAEIAPRVTV